MKDKFTIKVKLLSGREIRVPELTNRQYLHIIKYCENKDYEGLNQFLINLLNIDPILDILDRLYLLIYYRIVFISHVIAFKNDQQNTLEYDLNLCLLKLEELYTSTNHTVNIDNFYITLGLPRTLYFHDINHTYNSVICDISLPNAASIQFQTLSEIDQDKILSLLPPKIINYIDIHLNNISSLFDGKILIDSNDRFGLDSLKLKLLSNNNIAFISALYSHNILDFMETQYGFITKISASPDFFWEMSPIDSKIMLNIHNAEIEKSNQELQNNQQQPI